MVFSSSIFLILFLPVLLLTYFITPAKYKNIVLLVFSIFFYSWGAPKFVFVIIGTTFLDFYLVRWMYQSDSELKRKIFLAVSITINLGLLIYFKYSNFFIENLNVILSKAQISPIHWLKLVLPIGISFYTFETLTYVIDVYRKVHKPLNNFWEYQLYIILFPKLIAGPIVRYHEIADQIADRSANDTVDNKLTGFYRFVIGLAKKVLIANTMGATADQLFAMNPNELTCISSWIGALAYTFQIYFDFSGYSDMAIGLAKMFGFMFPENFNNPYTSKSITEFWRRWHITLGAWMRNYLYIPLGGNKVKSKTHLYLNLWIVFLVSGLWHGASWNFIIWGAYHGLFLVIERMGFSDILLRIGKFPSMLITFLIVVSGWVFFRIEGFEEALIYLKKMYSFNFAETSILLSNEFYYTLVVAFLFSFFTVLSVGEKIQNFVYLSVQSIKGHLTMLLIVFVLFTLSLSYITASGFNPFIYFRF